jgi:tape measure domain-containing protein
MANIRLTANERAFVNSMDNAAGSVGRLSATLNIQLARAMRETDNISRNFAQGFGKLGDRISGVGQTLTSAFTLPITIAAGAAAKFYGDIDQLKRALDVYGVSLNEIKQTAKLPGLGIEEAGKATINFLSVKYAADISNRAVREFGNALVYSGRGKEDLGGIAIAFAQMKGKGNVMAQEINQIAERLPMIRDLMMQAFGTSNTEVIQKMGITADEFLGKIVARLEQLPRVSGGFKTAWENVIDSVKLGSYELVNIADKLFDLTGALNGVSTYIDSLVASFKELSPEIQQLVLLFVGFIAITGPLMVAVGGLIKGYALLFTGTLALTSAISLMALALGGIIYLWVDYNATQNKIANASKTLAQLETEVKSSIHAQAEEVKKHTDVLNNNNSTLAQRKTAIEALKTISPEYFGKLDSEKIKYDQLNVAVSKYITNLENTAKANIISAQIDTSLKAEKDLLNNLGSATSDVEKMRAKFDQSIARGFKKIMGSLDDSQVDNTNRLADVITLNAANALTKIRQSRVSLQTELAELLKLGYKPTEIKTPTTTPITVTGTGKGIDLEELKKQRDILGKLNLKELISIGEKEFNQNYGKKALPTFFQDILDAGTRLKAGLPKIMVGLNMSEAGMTIDEQIKKNIADKAMLAFYETQEMISRMATDLGQNVLPNALASVFESLGSGEGFAKGLGNAFKSILSTIGSYMIELGKKALVATALIEGLKKAFGTVAGPAAALAMIAGGGLLKGLANSLFSQTPKFANGGIVSGPTLGLMGEYAGARSNPEVIAPLSKLKDLLGNSSGSIGVGEIKLRGEDLYIMLQRYNNRVGN